jgi:hypothetical protein
VGDWSPSAGRLSRIPVQPGPAAVLVIGLFGGAVGAAVIYIDWPFPQSADPFTKTGPFFLWLFLLCAQTALWALALIPIVESLRVLWRFGESNWGRVALSAGSLALALLLVSVAGWRVREAFPYEFPLPYGQEKLRMMAAIGGAVAISAGLGMALVHAGLTRLARDDVSSEDARDQGISDLLLLREHLQRLLAIEGAIIGAAVLATAALRNAVLAYSSTQPFPRELVLMYGGAFSIVLALFWAPIYGLLLTVGARIRDSAVGERGADEPWADWHDRRVSFEDVIGLKTTASASFRSAVAILTPLGSALLGLLFDT